MDHRCIYDKIISKAKFENRVRLRKNREDYIYYENHHIVPKCLCGSDEQYNRVLLTGKEHFICHKLLTYIYPKHRGIVLAFHYMTFGNSNKHIKSSRDYAYARELISLIPVSEETKNNLSKSHKGKPFTKEHKQNLSISNKGKHDHNGVKNPCFGKSYIAWNKGLTKKTDERVKKGVRSGEDHFFYNKHHTKDGKHKCGNGVRGKKLNLTPEQHLKRSNSLKGDKNPMSTKNRKIRAHIGAQSLRGSSPEDTG